MENDVKNEAPKEPSNSKMMLGAVLQKLESLRQSHSVCDGDCWYSCPASGHNCNEFSVADCDCGADSHNAMLDMAIADILDVIRTPNKN